MRKNIKEIPIGAKLDELKDALDGIDEQIKDLTATIEEDMNRLNKRKFDINQEITQILNDNNLTSYETYNNLFELVKHRSINVDKVKKHIIKTLQKRLIKVKETVTVKDAEGVLTPAEFEKVVEYAEKPRLYIKKSTHQLKRPKNGKKNGFGGEVTSR